MTKEQTNSWEEDFVEKGADLEHTRWSKWQEYFFSKCKTGKIDEDDKDVVLVLPRALYDRWWLQINTLYSELTEPEKESDRREVRQYLPLIRDLLSQQKQELVEEIRKLLHEPYTLNYGDPLSSYSPDELKAFHDGFKMAKMVLDKRPIRLLEKYREKGLSKNLENK